MVGLIEREEWITTQHFKNAGDFIFLLGDFGSELGASHYLKVVHGRKWGRPPRVDLERELKIQNALRELIRARLVRSAHDCSEGGLAVALAESCFNPAGSFGAELDLTAAGGQRLDEVLFNESQSRIVFSCVPANAEKVLNLLGQQNLSISRLGTVGGDVLSLQLGGKKLRWPLAQIHQEWFNAIANAVSGELTT
jgi:phosphoribosylformylglycinamidine synthase